MYAEHFLAADAVRPAHAVIHLWGFLFGVNPEAARRFVKAVAARWRSGGFEDRATPSIGIVSSYATLLSGHWRAGFQLRKWLKGHRGQPIFLVVSHHHLSRGQSVRNILRSFNARCVCLLHDLIPLDYPEYFPPRFAEKHRRVAQTIGDLFDAVIVNSESTADSFRRVLAVKPELRTRPPKVHVALPGANTFSSLIGRRIETEGADPVPYFVVLGTIEPRKNHLLLLNLWSRLATTMETPPRLLVIGARGGKTSK